MPPRRGLPGMDAPLARTSLAARYQRGLAVAYLVAAAAVVVLVNLHDRRFALDEARRYGHLLLDRNAGTPGPHRELEPPVYEIPGPEADGVFERRFLEDARREPDLELRAEEREVDGRTVLVVLHRGPPDGEHSALAVRVPLDAAYAEANSFSLRLSLALLAVLAALYGAQVLVERRLVFAPIARLRREAARLSERRTGFAPLELPAHPELRDLTAAFNEMAEATSLHREELERQVAERTAELVRASRELERTAREREHARKIEALGRLAGGVAHDFNNLLTAVHGYVNLLLESLDPGDARREDVLEIRRASDRASTLTRQLLAFSRREAVSPRVLDPNRVIAQLEGMLRRLIRENVRLELHLGPGVGPVRADPGQLEQIVVNLAVNARDAMPGGGRLVLRTRQVVVPGPDAPADPLAEGRWALISVEDSGVGMDPETLANAFEPFFTTKGRDAGTGLGLATVQAIVRQCGGAVVAESAPGEGSVFRVWLPVVDGAPEEPDPGRRQAKPAAAAGGVRVIVTEDDVAVRRLVSSVLRHAGYDVLEATDGAEALAVLDRAAEVHLLVTDLVMPGVDGQELARRARERRPGLPVLFITGHASPEELLPRVGPDEACLQKPFTPQALLVAVRPLADAFRGAR